MNIVLFIIIVLFEIYLAIMGNKPYKIEEDLLMNKELKILAEEIIKQIPTGERDIESGEGLSVNGINYNYETVEELEINDQGKYQHGGTIYSIGIFDKEKGYGIIGDTLFYIKQNYSRNGSYYTEYYYNYEKPYLVEQVEKVITTKVWSVIK